MYLYIHLKKDQGVMASRPLCESPCTSEIPLPFPIKKDLDDLILLGRKGEGSSLSSVN